MTTTRHASSTDPSVAPTQGALPDALAAAPTIEPETLDPSLATYWPRTLTSRLLIGAILVAAVAATYGPQLAADPIAALFLPVLLGAVAIAGLVLDLPLRAARPGSFARASGILGAALTVAGGSVAARVLAGADEVVVPSVIVGGCSLAAFWCASALSDWERSFFAATRRVLFVGEPLQYAELRREIHRHRGMRLVGHLALEGAEGELDDAIAVCGPTMLVLSAAAAESEELCAAAVGHSTAGLRLATLTDLYRDHFGRLPLRDLPAAWAIREIADLHRPRTYAFTKIAAERVASVVVLALLSPLLALSAVAIRLTSPGPVLYRQDRIGHRGEVITILKLRTMTTVPEHERAAWASDDLHRVTAVGRLLRRLRIDEAPQLISVVRGHMSLIGPRPEQVAIAGRLADELPFYQARHWVRPGLTGWAQIRFGYGGSFDGARQKLEYDLYYVERQSLLLDLRIAAGTLRAILRGVGT